MVESIETAWSGLSVEPVEVEPAPQPPGRHLLQGAREPVVAAVEVGAVGRRVVGRGPHREVRRRAARAVAPEGVEALGVVVVAHARDAHVRPRVRAAGAQHHGQPHPPAGPGHGGPLGPREVGPRGRVGGVVGDRHDRVEAVVAAVEVDHHHLVRRARALGDGRLVGSRPVDLARRVDRGEAEDARAQEGSPVEAPRTGHAVREPRHRLDRDRHPVNRVEVGDEAVGPRAVRAADRLGRAGVGRRRAGPGGVAVPLELVGHHITCASGPPSRNARSTRWRAMRSFEDVLRALVA